MKLRSKIFYFIQALLKYFPFRAFAKLRVKLYRPFFNKIGINVVIHDNVLIKFPEYISIGNNVQVSPGCIIVGGAELEIGNDVLIGAGTKITTSSHVQSRTDIPIRLQGLSFSPIKIGDDVWFGFNCVVLGGTVVRKGSIVGANSVLIGNSYDEFSIIVGIPGKVKKKRV